MMICGSYLTDCDQVQAARMAAAVRPARQSLRNQGLLQDHAACVSHAALAGGSIHCHAVSVVHS
jgi:hypothetical protein